MTTIRAETWEDSEAINAVIISAFRAFEEARLVKRLREEDALTLSLVAETDSQVVGHIGFSPVTLEFDLLNQPCLGLAPLSVKPILQNQGIGGLLVRKGLENCMAMGYRAVFVLGSPDYYSRFGFHRADKFGLYSEYDESGDHFMVLPLRSSGLDGLGGLVSYHPLFSEVGV